MIGVTVVPPTPSSIAGCDVRKPGPSPAVAGMATNVSNAAAPSASDANRAFLITPPLLLAGASLKGLASGQEEVQQVAGVTADTVAAPVRMSRQVERPRVGEGPQAALSNEQLVDAADAAAVRRVDGHAEGGGLAVHRA